MHPNLEFIGRARSQVWNRREMKAMKIIRNILGTAGLLYAGYVVIVSMKDVRRYIRISTM
jgi:hypothetical protein